MRNSNYTSGNRTRNLQTCSAMPQPNAPPCGLQNVVTCSVDSSISDGSSAASRCGTVYNNFTGMPEKSSHYTSTKYTSRNKIRS